MINKKDIRILYLQWFPLYGSGSGTYARYLAKAVSKHLKTQTAIVAPEKRKITGVKIFPIKHAFPVAFTGHPEWKNCKLFTQTTPKQIGQLYKTLLDATLKAVSTYKPNIIHVHHAFPFSWSARFIKATYGIPYIITVHGSEIPTAENDKRFIELTVDALSKAEKIVPNSYWTKDWMLKVFPGEYKKKIKVIPGGVDLKTFRYVSTSPIDKEYNLKGKKLVVFAGKLTYYKGVKYIVKAAKKIHGEIFILGDGREMQNLKQIVKDEQITNVTFTGHLGKNIRKLIEFYSRADVFVAPSVWDEPLGLVILEAMACKTPVVVTRKGGIPLAVKEEKNGLFIKARNVNDIAEKVNYLLDDDEKRKRMGDTALEIAKNKFSWDIIAKQFIAIYKKILETK